MNEHQISIQEFVEVYVANVKGFLKHIMADTILLQAHSLLLGYFFPIVGWRLKEY